MIEYLTSITDYIIIALAVVYLAVPALLITGGVVFYLICLIFGAKAEKKK